MSPLRRPLGFGRGPLRRALVARCRVRDIAGHERPEVEVEVGLEGERTGSIVGQGGQGFGCEPLFARGPHPELGLELEQQRALRRNGVQYAAGEAGVACQLDRLVDVPLRDRLGATQHHDAAGQPRVERGVGALL